MSREPRRDRLGREVYLLAELVSQRLTGEMEQMCQLEGISRAQYPVLWVLCLSDIPEGIPLGAISDGLVTRGPDVSRLVTRLEESGLVERRPSAEDGRVSLVRATHEGEAVFARTTARVKAMHRDQFADLADDELKALLSLLNRVFWTGVPASDHQAS